MLRKECRTLDEDAERVGDLGFCAGVASCNIPPREAPWQIRYKASAGARAGSSLGPTALMDASVSGGGCYKLTSGKGNVYIPRA